MNLASLWNLLGFGENRRQLHEAQLRGMSDRELADIGVGRSQIPAVLDEDGCHPGPRIKSGAGSTPGSRNSGSWIAGQARNDSQAGQARNDSRAGRARNDSRAGQARNDIQNRRLPSLLTTPVST